MWYAVERKNGCILAWHNWKKQDKNFLIFWKLPESFPVSSLYHTDDSGSYSKIYAAKDVSNRKGQNMKNREKKPKL